MHLSPVITPDGRPVFSAGGEQAWKTFEHRGFVVSLEWVGDHRRAAPCMCIWPATNVFIAGDGNGIWVISRRAITEFVGFDANGRCTGSASEHCYRECLEALTVLGKDRNDKAAFMALVDCVIKFAPDLVHMPVAPKRVKREMAGQAMWEITASNKETGKVISEAAV
jgi:hypothetical protein